MQGITRHHRAPGMTAELYQSIADLKLFDPPFEIPRVQLMMQWHSRANNDPGLSWLRDSIKQGLSALHRQYKSRLYRLALETI